MNSKRLFLGAVLAAALAAPSFADGRTAGSVLIFPVHRSGSSYTTIVSVTNTNVMPATPFSFGGSTLAHYEYANVISGSDGFSPFGCVQFDRVEFLTPADTLSVATSCHNATAGNQEGYLVVSAQDPSQFDVAWNHNSLIGSELVINGSNGMYSVNAISLKAMMRKSSATDHNGNGQLDFDGNEYEGVPEMLFIDSFIGVAGSHLALINLTGDAQARNTVQLTVWNDNEFPLSATRPFNCWFDQPLEVVSPLFSTTFLQGTMNDPSELDVDCNGSDDYETGWARVDSLGVDGGPDGALIGAITAGPTSDFDGGHLLWESDDQQFNGVAFTP